MLYPSPNIVAPLVGARIEMVTPFVQSHQRLVAPLVGARIEIVTVSPKTANANVAPLVGARIEIDNWNKTLDTPQSLPSWERGLKSIFDENYRNVLCRSPRGSED